MKFRSIVLSLFTISVLSVPAMAQNSVSVISAFAKPGQTVSATCKQEVQVFEQLASEFPHPKTGWRFVVLCDEPTWNQFMERSGERLDGLDHYGETDIDQHLTIIRGWKLIHPDLGVDPEHFVAHELAHVMLHSRNEAKVEKVALQWLAQQKQSAGSLLAAAAEPKLLNGK